MRKLWLLLVPVTLALGALLFTVHVRADDPPPAAPAAAATAEEWPEWTDPDEKIVPIFALGTPGVGLGFAQVAGPKARVEQIKSVVQLSVEFKGVARIKIFVPSSELAGMNRVQGVAVKRLLKYTVIKF